MSAADDPVPLSAAEAASCFADLERLPALVLAVSGGPDSTALLLTVARWRAALGNGPTLLAVTIDHGLRAESAREARAVKTLAQKLGVQHRTVRWSGEKPVTGLQEAARDARYRLLAGAAKRIRARHVLTGHTLDDQAETVLLRLTRGSGFAGLGAMDRITPVGDLVLVRPLLDVPKARLVATLVAAGIAFADDPSNRDPRFARSRLRLLVPALAQEGLDAGRLALLARRIRRADAAIETAVAVAAAAVSEAPWPPEGPIVFDAGKFMRLPEEIALRLLGVAVGRLGDEGPVQLGKLEALFQTLTEAESGPPGGGGRLRRTLAGALISRAAGLLTVERAPPRKSGNSRRRTTLTTRA